jgi:signal transduction histidine kinase
MTFFKKIRNHSVNSQIVFAFSTLTVLIIVLEIFAYLWIRQMLVIDSLKESFSQLKEKQMQMKSASNEFILREKTNEEFFASGESVYLNRYSSFLSQLKSSIEEIKIKGAGLDVIDEAEVKNLEAIIESYDEVFSQMVDKIKLRGYGKYGLIGDFDKSIKSLLDYDFGKDQTAVLNLEIFVKNYLLTGDENLINNISNEVYRFTLVLEEHVKDEEVEKVSRILINYEHIFKELTAVDSELGIYTGGGFQSLLFSAIDNLDQSIQLRNINARINDVYSKSLVKIYASFFLIVGVALLAAFAINRKLYRTLVLPIQEMKFIISRMSKGEVPKSIVCFKVDDLNEMAKALNNLVIGTRNYQEFANNIGNGNLDASFTPLSKLDLLGNSLLAMQKNLKANIEEQHNQMLELQKVNAELDSFTYHASHDLRAPLTTIQGLVNIGLNEPSIEMAHSYFEMIQNRINHMDTLLKDLISISYNNKTETTYEDFNFESEINFLLKSLQDPGRDFHIHLDIKQNCPFVSDPVRIKTILGNLLSNAFKYFNPDAQNHYISVTIRVDACHASVVIHDNGIGIDQAYKGKIYNMFFRATTRSTGTGLGMYIVKSMIDRLKGQISFESTLNEGTTFQVAIPNHHQKVHQRTLERNLELLPGSTASLK